MNGNKILKVGTKTDLHKLSESIYNTYTQDGYKEIIMRCIGSNTTGQAIRAIIMAGGIFATKGLKIAIHPSFKDIESGMTAIELKLTFVTI